MELESSCGKIIAIHPGRGFGGDEYKITYK